MPGFSNNNCMHIANRHSLFARQLFFGSWMIALALPYTTYAQVNLNGSFEATMINGRFDGWVVPAGTTGYHCYADSTVSYDGRQSMRIQATPEAKAISNVVFFQSLDFYLFKALDDITIRYHIRFNQGDSNCIHPYSTLSHCAPEFEKSKQPRVDIHAEKWPGAFETGQWLIYTTKLVPRTNDCKKLYFGLVFKGKVDINLDAITLYVNGKQLHDTHPASIALQQVNENSEEVHTGNDITVKELLLLQQPIPFGHAGNTTLSAAARRHGKKIAAILKAHPAITVQLEGHTCDTGTEEANERVGLARASAVTTFLQQEGIAPERLQTVSKSFHEPVVPNSSEANRSKNRRVVVKIVN